MLRWFALAFVRVLMRGTPRTAVEMRSLRRKRALVVAPLAFAAACGGAPVPYTPSQKPHAARVLTPPHHAAAPTKAIVCSEESIARADRERARVPALVAQGRLHRAVRVLELAGTLCANTASRGWPALARLLLDLGRFEDAERLAVRIEGSVDSTPEGRAAAAEVRAALAKSAAHVPDAKSADVAYEAGVVAASDANPKRDLSVARDSFLRAHALQHPNGRALFAAGAAEKRLGNHAAAQRLFDRAVVELERTSAKAVSLVFAPESRTYMVSPEGDVAWSPDGKRVGFAGPVLHNDVMVFDAATRHESLRLTGHTADVTSVQFSPDGKTIATASLDRTVRMWSAATGVERRGVDWIRSAGSTVAFAPDGKTFATGTRSIDIYDVQTLARVDRLDGHSGIVRSIAYAPDGKTLASCGEDSTIRVWDLVTRAAPRVLEGHKGTIASVIFSPDGRTIASSSFDGTTRVWDLATGNAIRVLEGSESHPKAAFSRNGKMLAVAKRVFRTSDWTPMTWKPVGGEPFSEVWWTVQDGPVFALAFSPDSKTLAGIGVRSHYELILWDPQLGKDKASAFATYPRPVAQVAFSADGGLLAARTLGATSVRLWDTKTGAPSVLAGSSKPIVAMAFAPDGKTLATCSADDALGTLSVTSRKVTHTFTGACRPPIAFAPDGKSIAVAHADRSIRIRDAATGNEVRRLVGHTDAVTALSYSPKGDSIASTSRDHTIRIWSPTTASLRWKLRGHDGVPTAVAYAPTGNLLSTAGDDHRVLLWDLDQCWDDVGSCKITGEFEVGNGLSPRELSWARDGGMLAAAFDAATPAKLLPVTSGSSAEFKDANNNGPLTIAIAPNGVTHADDPERKETFAIVATGSVDEEVRLWSEYGEPRLVLRPRYVRTEPSKDDADVFVDLVGEGTKSADAVVACAVGEDVYPFDLCRERFEVSGLLPKVYAGDASFEAP